MSNLNTMLIIDDLRVLKNESLVVADYATTPDEAIELFESGKNWDLISFDHDMGIDYKTGYDLTIRPVLEYIDANADRFKEMDPICYATSSNPYGQQVIKDALRQHGLLVIVPTEWEKKNLFDFRPWEQMTGN